MQRVKKLPHDPYESARVAGLNYVSAESPGISRRKRGAEWVFTRYDGIPVKSASELARIQSLAIPPAWKEVWICADPAGHLQAVGTDQRGRKQYRYHASFRELRNATKFSRMAAFGAALPAIRRHIANDLKLDGLPKRKVLATVVRLLESTSIRVGNEEYARSNASFGLTTLADAHVHIDGPKLAFEFTGKSGVEHCIDLIDRRLARIVQECQEIPGQDLFQYVDEKGEPSKVRSQDVNAYIREISGADFTAKDFRTWNGTREALNAFRALGPAKSITSAKRKVVEAVKQVAAILGNRPATCRKYYIHPAISDAYMNGLTLEVSIGGRGQDQVRLFSKDEETLLKMVSDYVPASALRPPGTTQNAGLARKEKASKSNESKPAKGRG